MSEVKETTSSLYRLTQHPVDHSDGIFALYPSLKLGARESAVHYARRLMPVIEALIAADPKCTDWALTAPPFHAIPAAANLLAREIFALWTENAAPPVNLSFVEIKEENQRIEDDNAHIDYSRLDLKARTDSRERSVSALVHHDGLAGRAVIFVNDIKVTGAQQRVMRRYFATTGVSTIHWVYIIEVEESLGKQAPQIEYEINNAKYAAFDEFARIVATENIIFTSKCVARLFSYDMADLAQLFGMLSVQRRARLLQLATQEGRYGGGAFREKIDLLAAFCSLDRNITSPPGTPGPD